MLIPATDPKTGERPPGVPPTLLQGQPDLALSGKVRATALLASGLDATHPPEGVLFNAGLNERGDIITLSVSAPQPEVASRVLGQYVTAFTNSRIQSVLDDAVRRAQLDTTTINTLTRKLTDVQGQLADTGVPLPPLVPDGVLPAVPEGTPNPTVLLLSQRNALLNEIQRRQSDHGQQTTLATVPN